jgi:heat shock protein HtpX
MRCILPREEWDYFCTAYDGTTWQELLLELKRRSSRALSSVAHRITVRSSRNMNTLKTGLLLAVLTLILVVGGQAFGGQQGMALALVIAVVMNFAAYFWSDKIALAMSGAQPVTPQQAPQLYTLVEGLCTRAGLPVPRLYVIPQMQPNAFATGRDPHHAAVAVTQGLLETMNRDELEGVIAHELSHVKNRDTLIMAVAATLAGAITYLAHVARWGLLFTATVGATATAAGTR